MEKRDLIAAYAYRYNGNWQKIRNAMEAQEDPLSHPIKEKYITIFDEEYPSSLMDLQCPPWILFYQGDISLLKKPMATIVGSRNISPYGKKVTEKAADILKESHVLVSGMAKGADACVHERAMDGGHTIGVIGSGLKTCYPKENLHLYEKMRQSDLILSEFPEHVGVQRYHFPWRNRILAALGSLTVVTQARMHSGTMLTVNEALEMNRDIYCFPYPFGYPEGEGCNKLIAEGAMILYDISQLRDIAHRKNLKE